MATIWGRTKMALTAARDAWVGGLAVATEPAPWEAPNPLTALIKRQKDFNLKWALYHGDLFVKLMEHAEIYPGDDLYQHTRLIYKHIEAVVSFYATTVYQGDLSTDGLPLPDGTRGAIPIDPQTGGTRSDQALRKAIAELWQIWNWRLNMALRPTYGAILGTNLVELVHDPQRRLVFPLHIWPGYITFLELDYVGNVKKYEYSYWVRGFLPETPGIVRLYRFTKLVDKDGFYFYKDGEPYDFFGPGTAVIPNPYGFVPAIVDRHKIGGPGEIWGYSATDGTRRQLLELNSLFAHVTDFQHKAFASPVIVRGSVFNPWQAAQNLDLPEGVDADQAVAESLQWLQGDSNAAIMQLEFDTGQTLKMLAAIKEGILEENPEATFYHDLRQMSQLTGPGAERALGDAASRCRWARAGYDSNTIKLHQMGVAMFGYHAHNDWATGMREDGTTYSLELTSRHKSFLPFDLDSYDQGALDFTIPDRPVVVQTRAEIINDIILQQGIMTPMGLNQLGLNDQEAKAYLTAVEQAIQAKQPAQVDQQQQQDKGTGQQQQENPARRADPPRGPQKQPTARQKGQ